MVGCWCRKSHRGRTLCPTAGLREAAGAAPGVRPLALCPGIPFVNQRTPRAAPPRQTRVRCALTRAAAGRGQVGPGQRTVSTGGALGGARGRAGGDQQGPHLLRAVRPEIRVRPPRPRFLIMRVACRARVQRRPYTPSFFSCIRSAGSTKDAHHCLLTHVCMGVSGDVQRIFHIPASTSQGQQSMQCRCATRARRPLTGVSMLPLERPTLHACVLSDMRTSGCLGRRL